MNKEIYLQLTEVDGVQHILKNEHNWLIMTEQAEKGRKHKHLESRQVVTVSDELYKILDDNQLIGLINSLEVSKKIPHKLVYLNKGADLWEKFYERTLQDTTYQTTSSDLYFFENQYRLIKDTINTESKINVVDIGGGNGEPAMPLLRQLQQDNLLNSYTAIDISSEMLEYTKKHLIRSGIRVPTDFHVCDFEIQSLQNILFKTKYMGGARKPTIVLALGGILFNSNDVAQTFKHVVEGLCPEDLFIVTNALDNPSAPVNFSTFTIPEIYELDTKVARLLNLSEDLTDNELIFNEKTRFREYNLVLQKDIDLSFKKFNHTVKLYKYDKINIWMHMKDTFESINQTANTLNVGLRAVIKHPVFDNVMYAMSRK
ncbi:class I SAM-dependent methyltransferase [Brasilonema sp. UFV-L1]|uniref:class I SAM-dependent methyltransferase n=1 Tax=Brasilonema sp. UFV-L1 TaxID=2234130 RepID=UPI0030D8975C